jgi:hypothetical protein
MRSFRTLLWLEHRRSWIWAVSLVGSLAFWAWGIKQVLVMDVGERLGIRSGLLAVACAIGALVLCLMIGRIRSETRHGQYQVLLLTPPSGYAHIAARYLYAAAVAFVYFIAIGFLYWWIAALAGIHLDARSLLELTLALPVYGMSVTILPLLAWTLLLMVFVSAYRVSGPGWVPGTVMLLGTPFALRWLWNGILRVSYSMPGWRLFSNAPYALIQRFGELDDDAAAQINLAIYKGVPLEPMLILLALSAVLLIVAGRIWQEVEA